MLKEEGGNMAKPKKKKVITDEEKKALQKVHTEDPPGNKGRGIEKGTRRVPGPGESGR